MSSNIITITADFSDHFSIAQLKGAILSLNPTATIVTASNQVEPFNIKEGAFVLNEVAKHYPVGTVHIGVIDPGVGTERQGVAIVCEDQIFIGPNNGLFWLASNGHKVKEVILLDNNTINDAATNTFHGRDIFARAAAIIAAGKDYHDLGQVLTADEIIALDYEPNEVIYVDPYGNVKLYNDCSEFEVGDVLEVNFNGQTLEVPYCRTFAEVNPGDWIAYHGSNDTLELAINLGNAAKNWGLKTGDVVSIKKKAVSD